LNKDWGKKDLNSKSDDSPQLTVFAAAPIETGGGCLQFFALCLAADA
jgi:hypothetical protein